MIRGSIDFVSRSRVEGWIFSDMIQVNDVTVLAFVHDRCVGTGVINVFRQDLLAAGMGDGKFGFGFAIHLRPAEDPRILDIRVEGSNFMIRQACACLMPQDEVGADRRRQPRDLASLSWMLSRGWVNQHQYEALRLLGQFGVYNQCLRLSNVGIRDSEYIRTFAKEAGELLELQMLVNVSACIRLDVEIKDLHSIRYEMHDTFPAIPPVIALWAPIVSCLNIVEGSHLHTRAVDHEGGIDYEFGNDHLLWLNLDALFTLPTGGASANWIALLPTRAPI